MTVGTVAGVLIGVTADSPATYDAAGYGALTFTNIGEITDGGEHGRSYNLVTHNPIATRGTAKFKGSFNEGQKTLQLALDSDDAGQILLKTALNSDDDYSFEVQYPNGDIDWFQAKVMSYSKATGGVDSMITATVQLEITTNSAGVGIIESLAT